ncbi:MAG: hypothetical protein Q8927_12005 [Bacteroidota bacterium]|nr:hypothetical protein [Bacteroidota bacterium]MDP4216915.1 hypothetical protein [Bacteroidota bacterium]MDP4245432.1 hypothetical protein [Bacteroidota bacterium]MDP4255931.1 hypothetical protein [Bacteroidota bacterium]
MKNTIITAASILFVMGSANAQNNLVASAHPAASARAGAQVIHLNSAGLATQVDGDVDRSELKDKTVLLSWNEEGARYRAFFTAGGNWLHTLVSYEKDLLPARVRDIVRGTYHDLPIVYVDELRTPDQATVYRVQLQDDKKLVIVKVAGDELEKEAEFRH